MDFLSRNIRRVLLLTGLSLAAGLAAAQTPALGSRLDELLVLARQQSPELAAVRLEADAAAERITAAGALPDPKFRMELQDITRMGEQRATLDPSRVGSTKYTLMQDIPWFGKRDLRQEIAELDAKGVSAQASNTWNELASQIKTLQAQRLYAQQKARLSGEQLDLMVRLEKLAQARYAGGLAAQQDVIRAQVEQTGLRNELLAINNEQQQQLHARLNALLARKASEPLAEVSEQRALPAPEKLDFATLAERLRASNPALFADDAKLLAAEKNRDLAYRNRYPDVTLGVSPIQYGNSVRDWEVMLEVSIPLQQGNRRAQERESEKMLAAARARKEVTANRLLGELASNLAGIDTARQTEQLATSSLLPQAELTYRSALASYETGKVDFATLLDAQRQIRQARLAQYKAQVEMQIRLAEIEKLLGEDL